MPLVLLLCGLAVASASSAANDASGTRRELPKITLGVEVLDKKTGSLCTVSLFGTIPSSNDSSIIALPLPCGLLDSAAAFSFRDGLPSFVALAHDPACGSSGDYLYLLPDTLGHFSADLVIRGRIPRHASTPALRDVTENDQRKIIIPFAPPAPPALPSEGYALHQIPGSYTILEAGVSNTLLRDADPRPPGGPPPNPFKLPFPDLLPDRKLTLFVADPPWPWSFLLFGIVLVTTSIQVTSPGHRHWATAHRRIAIIVAIAGLGLTFLLWRILPTLLPDPFRGALFPITTSAATPCIVLLAFAISARVRRRQPPHD